MKHRVTLFAILLIVTSAAVSVAGPIFKPRKYHGPIPQNSLTLRFGFLAGATNAEMFTYFDTRVPQPVRNETVSNDFGNAPLFELTYTYKMHPQFAVRANAYLSLLTSDWTGIREPAVQPPDTATSQWLSPTITDETTFNVDLFVLELSALYYFTDASVKEFQPYFGGGFSVGLPHQKLKSTQTILDPDADDGYQDYVPIYEKGDLYKQVEKDEWAFAPGVHGILGALYYLNNKWAVSVEGRIQLMQSKFPITILNEMGEPEEVKFDIDYSGFILAAGISYAF
jgi:hypothetical protein